MHRSPEGCVNEFVPHRLRLQQTSESGLLSRLPGENRIHLYGLGMVFKTSLVAVTKTSYST